jgi:methylthioribulose-1-phosphate dehydratase
MTRTPFFIQTAQELAQTAQASYQRGWSPATSTNFSTRLPEANRFAISRSGIDKSICQPSDILQVDERGVTQPGFEGRPSAETPLHIALYRYSAHIGAVVHTHSIASTLLSLEWAPQGKITFSNLEILKGFQGTTTHETSHDLPIFPNSQDMEALGKEVITYLEQQTAPQFGLLIEGHGLYAWGADLAEAKRHCEAYEFLLSCLLVKGQREGARLSL